MWVQNCTPQGATLADCTFRMQNYYWGGMIALHRVVVQRHFGVAQKCGCESLPHKGQIQLIVPLRVQNVSLVARLHRIGCWYSRSWGAPLEEKKISSE